MGGVLGCRDARGRRRGGVGIGRERCVEQRSGEACDEGERREDDRRPEEADRRVGPLGVGQTRTLGILLDRIRTPEEPCAVRGREDRAQHDAREGDDPPRRAVDGLVEQRRQCALLCDESDRRDDADHRGDRDRREGRHDGRLTGEPAQLADVAGRELAVDHADDEEEARLEERMADEQGEAREGGIPRPEAEHDREEAELAHRAEREKALEVGLAQRLPPAEEHREDAERHDDRSPRGSDREDGRQSRDQVDAGLHHRRGVQIRAHRSRRGHGARAARSGMGRSPTC